MNKTNKTPIFTTILRLLKTNLMPRIYFVKIALVLGAFLINTSLFSQVNNDASKKLFSQINAADSGISFRNDIVDSPEANILIYEAFYSGAGVGIGDLNNDGLPDIYFAGNQVGDKLYLNKGNLQFDDITENAGIQNKGGWSTGVNILDINGDGFKDIYVSKSLYDDRPDLRQNELYLNNGDLTFTESAVAFNLNDPFRAMHANFFDYDKDGDFDLFLINQPPNPSILSPLKGQNWLNPKLTYRFLKNVGNRFEEATEEVGLDNVGYGLSSVTADFNNDGWPDLYVANDYEGPDFLYINNQDGTFTNKINEYLKHTSFFSMGADVADINNDGLLDFSVVDMVAEDNFRIKSNMSGMNPQEFWNIVELGGHYQYMYNVLQLNNGQDSEGNLRFSDIGHMAGASSTDWSWSPLFADFDNNGFQDLYITNGIKRDVRNTDALKEVDYYLAKINKKYPSQNLMTDVIALREKVSIDTLLSFFPVQKLSNYMFKNDGELNFDKAMDAWGINQESFSSGAAYGDLDNDGDLDLVVNNVDELAFVYRNNATELNKNNYLNVKFANGNKANSFFGTRITIHYQDKLQVREFTSARGFYSSSEELAHFGLSDVKRVDSLVVNWTDGTKSVLKKVKANQTLIIDKEKVQSRPNEVILGAEKLFTDQTTAINVNHKHSENDFDDYEREVLLPHRMSEFGPSLAVSDVNSDGLEDFFVGASVGNSGSLYVQNAEGKFTKKEIPDLAESVFSEDMGVLFFDADLDGDNDLYISSGSNEFDAGSYLYNDRFYLNDGKGNFSKTSSIIPDLKISSSKIIEADYDKDGDLDLFVCGRQVPGSYPSPAESYLLQNMIKESGQLKFEKVNNPEFVKLGMVTDAVWTDFDNDNGLDLMVVGEWMPLTIFENEAGNLKKMPISTDLKNTTGWWYSLEVADIDNDGDDDYIIGNLGLNYKYKASEKEPFTVNYGDFDKNGKGDIKLGYYNYGEHYPLRGRSCSTQQVPGLKESFTSYNQFALANLANVYGSEFLNESLEYKANTFASICLENKGKGKFEIHQLPSLAQVSSINGIEIIDVDKDGLKDVVIAGNMYGSEVETTRNDAGVGLFLKGLGNCEFKAVPMHKSGLNLPYDVKDMKRIKVSNFDYLLIGVNDDLVKMIKY